MTDDPPRSRFDTLAVVLGVIALLLAVATVVQAAQVRALQQQVRDGQGKLAQAQTMANLDNSLIQLMAKTAAENDDNAIRDLLERNGVTFKPPPTPSADVSAAGTGR